MGVISLFLGSGGGGPPTIGGISGSITIDGTTYPTYSGANVASLQVTAYGSGLTYQWYRSSSGNGGSSCGDAYQVPLTNNSRFSGVTTDTLSFSNVYLWYEDSSNSSSTTGWYKCIISNSKGTVSTVWMYVVVRYNPHNCNCLGQNCQPCTYDCNCNCYWEDNCCCYDSNGDGVTCCDATGDVNQCCVGAFCGQSYNCYNCSTCTDYCAWNCTDNPCSHNCQYQTCDTCYDESYLQTC